MSIMLWVTGRVWPYVGQRSEAVEHAVLRQLLFINHLLAIFFNESFYDDIYMKYTQFLKLLLATIAKSSSVAKF